MAAPYARAFEPPEFLLNARVLRSRELTRSHYFTLHQIYPEARASYFKGHFGLSVEADAPALQGSYLNTEEWNQLAAPQWEGSNRLEWESVIHKEDSLEWRLRLRRLKLSAVWGPGEFMAGRLRNGFGSARVFIPPMDRLDALPSAVSEEFERPGSDTLGFQGSWESIHLRAAYLWARDPAHYRAYAYAQRLITENVEASFIAGRLEPETDGAGAALQASSAWGEWRAESSANRLEKEELFLSFTPLPVLNSRIMEREFWRHLLLWERAFRSDWIASVEHYYNGRGAQSRTGYDVLALLRGEDAQQARRYWGGSVTKIISPLWSAGLKAAWNQEDRSAAFSPRIQYSAPGGEWKTEARAVLNEGSAGTEYGLLPNRFELDLTVFFGAR